MGNSTDVSIASPNPTILLLGCGYTLRRVAAKFDPAQIVLAVRTQESAAELAVQYPFVHALSTANKQEIEQLVTTYPSLQCVIDGIPPFDGTLHQPVEGVVNTVAALRFAPALKRVIYLSTTGVFGVTDGSVVTEDSPAEPANKRSKARLMSEQLYRDQPVPVTVVRIAAIYGPGRGIGTALKSGRYKMLEEGMQWSNRIQVDDLAALIKALIEAETPAALVCASDGNPSLQKDVVDFYCSTFDLPKPPVTSRDELEKAGAHTRLSNQQVRSMVVSTFLPTFRYPDYRAGAHTEFA